MTQVLIYGGTGGVGSVITDRCVSQGIDVVTVGVEQECEGRKGVTYVHKDRVETIHGRQWDAIIDVYNFEKGHEEFLWENFHDLCNQFIVISTTLIYDRSKWSVQRISSDHPKAPIGSQGGYVDKKIKVENYWDQNKHANYTLLRPYHILGPQSYLGCIPPHNRNPMLQDEIRKGWIVLCDGGRIPLNVVHPNDIAEVVLRCIGNPNVQRKAYNVVNPQEIVARDYYLKIAGMLGVKLEFSSVPAEACWQNGDWALTTLPHLYDTRNLLDDIGYVPNTGLEKCLSDAIKSPSRSMDASRTEVYRRMHLKPICNWHKYYTSIAPLEMGPLQV